MPKNYPSDITHEQFEKIKPLLESARKKTRPRTLNLYEIFCAVLYVLKSGCQWRMLPENFPNWNSVYAYFAIWTEKPDETKTSILEDVLKKIGRRNAYHEWKKRQDEFLYRGRSKC